MLLQVHKQFEGMVNKMGKSGMMGNSKQAQQQQQAMAAQMRRNPNFINQRLNQMDPKMLEQMGGREQVKMQMEAMAKGNNVGNGLPGMGNMPGGISNMQQMMASMSQGQGGGQMPDMATMMKMAQNMGLGGR